jgi:predicted dehydrogenase
MFRLGILGSDNSHAEIFSKLVNLPGEKGTESLFPDMKATCIFGLDEVRTRQVAEDGMIPFIVKSPQEMIGKVDAVMAVFRHGGLHLQHVLPFIRAGIPTWVDKPFAISNEDARVMLQDAARCGTLLTGGSTCRHTYDVLALKNAYRNGSRAGNIHAAVMNFPATVENEYGGIYFYGAHLSEMATEVFGNDAKSVVATKTNGMVTAIVKYDKLQLVLNFLPDCKSYHAVLYGDQGTVLREIDITNCYIRGFERFAEMLRTGKAPLSAEDMFAPVELLNAVRESYETGREVFLKGY